MDTPGPQTSIFIAGVAVGAGSEPMALYVDGATGQLTVPLSSQRYKRDIQDMGSSSEAILALRPVSFVYKGDLDPNHTPHYGLVAEEVAKIAPQLVIQGKDGLPLGVRYDAVNAMLLNEFLKEHQQVENEEKTITNLNAALLTQQKEIADLKAEFEAMKQTAAAK